MCKVNMFAGWNYRPSTRFFKPLLFSAFRLYTFITKLFPLCFNLLFGVFSDLFPLPWRLHMNCTSMMLHNVVRVIVQNKILFKLMPRECFNPIKSWVSWEIKYIDTFWYTNFLTFDCYLNNIIISIFRRKNSKSLGFFSVACST